MCTFDNFFFSSPHKTERKRVFRQCQIANRYLVFIFRWNNGEVLQDIGDQREGDELDHFKTDAHSTPVSKGHKVFGFENFAVTNES